MRRSLPVISPPPFQQYDCTMCGACCRAGFAVLVTDEERKRIEGQGWDEHPLYKGKKLFIKQIGGETVLNTADDGSCLFIDEENRCRIHSKFGAEGKPFACRPYPFMFLATGSEIRVSLRFDCPAVAANEGRPLPQHHRDMQALASRAVPDAAAQLPPPPFRSGVEMSWRDTFTVARAFERLVADSSVDVTRRMLVCADLLGLLRGAKMHGLEGKKLDEELTRWTTYLLRGVAENPLARQRPIALLPVLFRQAVGLYGRLDRVADTQVSIGGKVLRLGQRLAYALRLAGGLGRMPSVRPGLPAVRFADIERPFGIPSDEASEVLTRYYRIKLGSLGFCGRAFYQWGVLEGVGALLLTYPLILWYARLFAIGEGKSAIDAACMQRAVRVIDRPRGVAVPLSLRPERFRMGFLSEHENLSTLIVWYGT